MTEILKESIGSFVVATRQRERKVVVVSQKTASHYTREKMFDGKHMNLDHIDGQEVFKTKDPNIFKLYDGTELRKLFYCK